MKIGCKIIAPKHYKLIFIHRQNKTWFNTYFILSHTPNNLHLMISDKHKWNYKRMKFEN